MQPNGVFDAAELVEQRREDALEHGAVEWDTPNAAPTAPPSPPPPPPGLFKPELLSQDPSEWVKQYADSLLADPAWRAEQERKQREKAERQKRKGSEKIKGQNVTKG